MEHPIKMDDLEVALFLETPIYDNELHITPEFYQQPSMHQLFFLWFVSTSSTKNVTFMIHMCHGQSRLSRFWGDGCFPTFNDGILISWVYKTLRTWVDEFIPYYMEIMGVYRPWHISRHTKSLIKRTATIDVALRILTPQVNGVILRTRPLLYRFKPFHWRVLGDS